VLRATADLLRGEPPPALAGKVVDGDVGHVQAAANTARSQLGGLVANLAKIAGEDRLLLLDGARSDVAPWLHEVRSLCASAELDEESDAIRKRAIELTAAADGFEIPEPAMVDDWLEALGEISTGRPALAFWRALRIYFEPGFRDLINLHRECDALARQMQVRIGQILGAPLTNADPESAGASPDPLAVHGRLKAAAERLTALLDPEVKW
jgi:hypothetical protein